MEVIEGHPAEKPLFLYLAYQAPHMNIQVLAMILVDSVGETKKTFRSPLQSTWMSTQGRESTRRDLRKTIRRSIELLL